MVKSPTTIFYVYFVQLKILATDYRKSLLSVAVNPFSSAKDGSNISLPSNRQKAAPSSGWTYSDEIHGAKTNDVVELTCDALVGSLLFNQNSVSHSYLGFNFL